MTATRWPDVVDAIVDLMRGQAGYRTPGAESADQSGCLVLDGPEVELTADTGTLILIVGGQLDVNDTEDIGDAGQAMATLGPGQTRDDSGEVVCQIVAQNGGLDLLDPGILVPRQTIRVLRRSAFTVLDQVDTALRGSVTLGFTGRMVARLGDRTEPRQWQTETGAVVAVTFRVRYDARV